MKKLIIFDWDDVFTIGSKEAYFACYNHALEEVGIFNSKEDVWAGIKAKWGRVHEEVIAELTKEKPEVTDKAIEIYEKTLFDSDIFVENISILEGVQDFLSVTRSRHAEISGSRRIHKNRILRRHAKS